MFNLIAVTLTLVSATDATLPPHLGRANYATTLARLSAVNPLLAQAAHSGDGPRPLTCSGLLNAPANRAGTRIVAGQEYYLRVTGLEQAVAEGLVAGLVEERPATWELDRHVFRVAASTCDEEVDPWSGRDSYERLAADALRAERAPRSVTLRFASATSFRSREMNVPVPLPGLVFGSLVERWNAFSPVALSPEMRRFGEERVAISRYQLRSRPVAHKQGALRIGGVGEVTYQALGGDRYWLAVMQVLARFARFSGVGVQTTTGMGQVRQVA